MYIGNTIAKGEWSDLAFYASCVLANIFGASIFECLSDNRWSFIKHPLVAATAVNFGLFALAIIIDITYGNKWQVVPLSVVMGLQNSVGLKPESFIGMNTTIVTGTCHRTGCFTYLLLVSPDKIKQKDRHLLLLGLCVIAFTVIGAIVGAVVVDYASNRVTWWHLLPAWGLQAMCFLAHERFAPFIKKSPELLRTGKAEILGAKQCTKDTKLAVDKNPVISRHDHICSSPSS